MKGVIMFLEMQNIRKSYGEGESRVEVLRGVELSLEKGQFAVLFGPSGSGKSTLLNILGGIDTADEGEIRIGGLSVGGLNEKELSAYRRDHLGYVFQMYNLIPNLTVRENIEVGAYLSRKPLHVDELLETLGLSKHANKVPNQLSGGQQQRCSIGRAIVKNPDILLCDEPTGALDYNTSREILALIEKVNRVYGNTIVMVTLFAALVGNILGYTVMKNVNANLYYSSYSLPTYETRWSTEALIETTLIPIASMLVINISMLTWKLRLSPLKFLRRDLKKHRSRGAVRLSTKLPFFTRFRLRIVFQNLSSYILLAFGILFANFLLLFGLMFPSVLKNYMEALPDNMISAHQYILKLPEGAVNEEHRLESLLQMMLFRKAVETENETAEKFSAWTLDTVTERGMKDEEILLYGITENSRYVDLSFTGDEVYISQSLAEKRMLEAGDRFRLKEKYDEAEYEFTVAGVYPYSGALAVFMSREALNERFDLGKDTFSGYFSDSEITDIDEKYIGQRVDFESLSKVSRQLDISMGAMMKVVDVFAIVMYIVLIYLLSKTIIEKNAGAISMSKILGFTNRELGKLYVLVTSIVVVVCMAGSIPLEVLLLTSVFRVVIRLRMSGWIPFILSGDVYVKMLALGLSSYAVLAVFEFLRISRIPKTEALKNVE